MYKLDLLTVCSDSVEESEFLITLDQNEIIFEDYNTMHQISRLPPFTDPIDLPNLEGIANIQRNLCLQYIQNLKADMNAPPESRGNEI